MAWRRDVRRTRGTDEESTTRAGVQAAKVALGERGTPWWEQSDEERRARWSADVPSPGPDTEPPSSRAICAPADLVVERAIAHSQPSVAVSMTNR